MALLQEEGKDMPPETMVQEEDIDKAVYAVPDSDSSTTSCVAYSVNPHQGASLVPDSDPSTTSCVAYSVNPHQGALLVNSVDHEDLQ